MHAKSSRAPFQARFLTPADYGRLVELTAKLDPPQQLTRPGLIEFAATANNHGRVICVDEDGRHHIVGFMLYGQKTKDRRHRNYSIDQLHVAPTWRRQGIGTALVEHLTINPNAPANARVLIDVSDLESGTHVFLERKGFRAIKVIWGALVGERDRYRFLYESPALATGTRKACDPQFKGA